MSRFLNLVTVVLLLVLPAPSGIAFAADTSDSTAEIAPDTRYLEAKALVEAEDYAGALVILGALVSEDPINADVWNLQGFSNRKLGQLDLAAQSYAEALRLNPAHLGALEYQGEMFIELKQLDQARANLETLKGLCADCEETLDLAEMLGAAG